MKPILNPPSENIHEISCLFLIITSLLLTGCGSVPEPVASFKAQPRQVILGDTILFTNQSSNYTSVLWDFGDGKISTDVNVSHVYNKPGDYNPSITVSAKDKSKTSSLKITVMAPGFTVKYLRFSEGKISFTCTSEIQVAWKLNDSIVSYDLNPEIMINPGNISKISLLARGTSYSLWDTTIDRSGVQVTQKVHAESKPTEAIKTTYENTEQKTQQDPEISAATTNSQTEIEKAPATKVPVINNVRVSPQSVLVGNSVTYSCNANVNVKWDFNGESSTTKKQGRVSFNSPGTKTITLSDADGNEVQTFHIEVKYPVSTEEVETRLNQIANEGVTRDAKRNLANEIYTLCLNREKTKISGLESGLLSDFITKIMIESSEFVKVSTKVDLRFDKNGRISEIILDDYKKTEIQ